MRLLLIIALSLVVSNIYPQETSPYLKFGKITSKDLQKKNYSVDPNASAVVLSDIGNTAIEGNSKGWFSASFTRHRVVHILNKNGYDEANVQIHLYSEGNEEEKLDNIKAVTYNLENGKIVESRLEKSAVFKVRTDKNTILASFTFPNVKEGCIIEYEYSLVSDYIQNLDPWYFQGLSPVLWSEYTLSVPQFFTYVIATHGYHDFFIKNKKDRTQNFAVINSRDVGTSRRISFSASVTDFRWVMKEVPELREESYTSSLKNHIARIEFQLASQSDPLEPHDYRNSWEGLTKELLNSPYFGNALNNANNWLSDDVNPLLVAASPATDKARKIYAFVRDHYTCTDHSALFAEQPLKNVMRSKKGNVAEINLLLTAMLRYAGLQADPVILSTTDHGYALQEYPMITNFNYVLSQCIADGKKYFLDASQPQLGFGKLLPLCYNGHARVINEAADPVYFSADSLKERKVTTVFIGYNEKGNKIGSVNQTLGFDESNRVRNERMEKGREDFLKNIQRMYGDDTKINAVHIDSLMNYEEPIGLKYEMDLGGESGNLIYVSPMFDEKLKKNPFELAQRFYPVEMPYTIDETYLLTMKVPEGYTVDELPKQLVAKLDEKESAYFEYFITLSGSTISLRTRLKIARTFFANDEYGDLRDFFNLIIRKQNEQIVFKKKS